MSTTKRSSRVCPSLWGAILGSYLGCSSSGSGDEGSAGAGDGAGSSTSTGGGAGEGAGSSTAGDSEDPGTSSEGSGESGADTPDTEDGSGLPVVICAATTELQPGREYGDYTLFAIRAGLDVPPAVYSVRVHDGQDGTAYVIGDDALYETFDYDPSASLVDAVSQTVGDPGSFEFDLRSQTRDDLSGLDASIFDGCHTITVEAAIHVEAGETYGAFVVEDVTVSAEAPGGTYTFFTPSGNTGVVELRRDGDMVDSLDYAWTTTIGGGETFTFVFPDVVSLTVGRAMGTSNLFGLADTLFDGRHELVVE